MYISSFFNFFTVIQSLLKTSLPSIFIFKMKNANIRSIVFIYNYSKLNYCCCNSLLFDSIVSPKPGDIIKIV
jgi:hypothetical protein